MTRRADQPARWRVAVRVVRRVWVTVGSATLALMPVYAWWTYTPRLPVGAGTSDAQLTVSTALTLDVRPRRAGSGAGLIWIAGCLVPAEAYLPLARDVARAGHPVSIVALPWRCAPLPAQRADVVRTVRRLVAAGPARRWVVGGHSKGATIACDVAADPPARLAGVVLAGTTHPRDVDLSRSRLDVTKVVATRDGIAPITASERRRHLLPADVTWIEIAGGNHSQFGWYGWQLGDGRAIVDRETQQRALTSAVLEALERVDARRPGADDR